MEYDPVVLLCTPIIAPAIAGALLYSGLSGSTKIGWWRVAFGIALLGLTCYGFFYQASLGGLVPVFAFLVAGILTCVVVITGIWMFWKLRGPRRVMVVVVGLVFPIALYAGIYAGNEQSPENSTQRNGNTIVQALDRSHAGDGTYPEKLADLEPSYLPVEPQALTTQGTGWLYTSTGAEFTLGYWYWPYKFGAWVCLYKSPTQKWECDDNNWGPFQEVPTPGPW